MNTNALTNELDKLIEIKQVIDRKAIAAFANGPTGLGLALEDAVERLNQVIGAIGRIRNSLESDNVLALTEGERSDMFDCTKHLAVEYSERAKLHFQPDPDRYQFYTERAAVYESLMHLLRPTRVWYWVEFDPAGAEVYAYAFDDVVNEYLAEEIEFFLSDNVVGPFSHAEPAEEVARAFNDDDRPPQVWRWVVPIGCLWCVFTVEELLTNEDAPDLSNWEMFVGPFSKCDLAEYIADTFNELPTVADKYVGV